MNTKKMRKSIMTLALGMALLVAGGGFVVSSMVSLAMPVYASQAVENDTPVYLIPSPMVETAPSITHQASESSENYIPIIEGNFSFEILSQIEPGCAVLLGRMEIEQGVTYHFDIRYGISIGGAYIGFASPANAEGVQTNEAGTWLELIESRGQFTSDKDMDVYVYIVVPQDSWVVDVWGGIYPINSFPSPQLRPIPRFSNI